MSSQVPPAVLQRIRWLGHVDYDEALDLQRAIWEGRVSGRTADDYLLLLEHNRVYTIGRSGNSSNLLLDKAGVESVGATVREVDRGGDITYHGPGQLVGYPIQAVRVLPGGFDMTGHLRRIEQLLIATLGEFGIRSWAEEGLSGVWTSAGKIAAIGIRVARGVAMHGFALNVNPDMDYFANIIPCGIPDRGVASMADILSRDLSIEEVVSALIPQAVAELGEAPPEVQLGAFDRGTGVGFDVDRMVREGVFSGKSSVETPVVIRGLLAGEPERPEWMKVRAQMDEGYLDLERLMRKLELNTVCEEAGCPNIYECWSQGTATMMLLGDRCTRACSFCSVTTARPGEVDLEEPARAADAVQALGLKHAVLTSVNRDDLPDGGAGIFAETIRRIRDASPDCDVEVLIPDFKGDPAALDTVMAAKPSVLSHNTETVIRLQRDVRTGASYGRSLTVLARAKWANPAGTTKSGLIVGMGETEDEILGVLADLRSVGVDIVTIGQYLRPTAKHRPIDRYVTPEEFDRYSAEGIRLGIPHVESGPLVRSSYHARESLSAIS